MSGGTPPEVPPSLMVGTCYYGMDDGALSARAIGGGTGSELPPPGGTGSELPPPGGTGSELPPGDGRQDAPSDAANRMGRYLAQALRSEGHA